MKKVLLIAMTIILALITVSCGEYTPVTTETQKQNQVTKVLTETQPTPTDIDYSLERYNLIKRAYWVNGQREKANILICGIDKPLGYIVLFTEGGSVVGRFVVDGKVTSLNSYLTPDSEYYEKDLELMQSGKGNLWLADVDGSYGENDNGIFFFTPDGKYIEWTGIYLYSDIPFEVDEPVVRIGAGE